MNQMPTKGQAQEEEKHAGWIAASTTIASEQAQFLEEIFYGLEAISVTITDAGDDPILEPGCNETPIWDHSQFQALFERKNRDQEPDLSKVFAALKAQIESALQPFAELAGLTFSIELIEEQDWVRKSLNQFKPIQFNNALRITPSWSTDAAIGNTEVVLDPGLAFGTGSHATTYLCLDWLDQQMPAGLQVLDFGCGSGILGIAALKLGAKHASFVDNDPQALSATEYNLARNTVDKASYRCCHAEDLLASNEELSFDLVLANILASTLVDLSQDIARLCKPGGMILLSGILTEQEQQVKDAYAPYFDEFQCVDREQWLRISACRSIENQ